LSILQSCQKTKKEHGEPCSKAEKKRVIDLSIRAVLPALLAGAFVAQIILHVTVFAALTRAALAFGKVVFLLAATRTLLSILVLIFLTCSTHIPVEIVVVPHSVICHLTYSSPLFGGLSSPLFFNSTRVPTKRGRNH